MQHRVSMKTDAMRHVTNRADVRRFVLFLAAGGTATVVQCGILVALVEAGRMHPTWAAILAYFCGAMTSYLLNFRLTFRNSGTSFRKGLAKFLIVNVIGLGLNTLIFVTLRDVGAYYLLAQAMATGLVLIWNYAGARLFVFRGKPAAVPAGGRHLSGMTDNPTASVFNCSQSPCPPDSDGATS
jgi:putative flippase GtrA